MGDQGKQQVRERVWIEKFDHTEETPVLVETEFFERVLPNLHSSGDDVTEST